MAAPTAILAAMEQEIRLIEARLEGPSQHRAGGRSCITASLAGKPVVTATSGFGKVAAAATVTTILDTFHPSCVIFGGVAGGIGTDVGIGDIVIAERLVQHDFDASPIFDKFVIPSLGVAEIPTDADLTEQLHTAAVRFVDERLAAEVHDNGSGLFVPEATLIHRGLIASGDRFIDHPAAAQAILGDLPDVLAVEMEGAAVAQVCAERDVPFAVFRSISDRADREAHIDFLAFIRSVAAPITAGLVEELLSDWGPARHARKTGDA